MFLTLFHISLIETDQRSGSMMPKWLQVLYMCYLGKTKGRRLSAICRFVKEHDGREFFDQYSTQKDSIIEFLKKCDARGLDLE